MTAVSTTKLSLALAAAEKFEVKHAFDNEFDLVNCPDVDLVVIVVKARYHYNWSNKQLKQVNYLLRRPSANSTKEAIDLKKAIADILIGEVLSSSMIGYGGGWANVYTKDGLYLLDPVQMELL